MRIERLDPANNAFFGRFADIHRQAESVDNPRPLPFQPVELRALLSDEKGSQRWTGYVGLDGETVVAAGLITTTVNDNLDKANLSVWVEPENRWRGFGSAMTDALVQKASDDGRTILLAQLNYPLGADESHPYRAFAAKHGFRLANVEVHRALELPVASDHLDELIAEAAPHHAGYTFVEHDDETMPEGLLPSYIQLVNALLADAPTGDVDYESGGATPEMFRAESEVRRAQGRRAYRTIALDADERAAAYSMLVVPLHDPGKVFQWGTLVGQRHRGHRLGLAVKARNLRTVQSLYPDRHAVHTWNAASNTHMISVNETLGFRAVAESAEYVRILTDARPLRASSR